MQNEKKHRNLQNTLIVNRKKIIAKRKKKANTQTHICVGGNTDGGVGDWCKYNCHKNCF